MKRMTIGLGSLLLLAGTLAAQEDPRIPFDEFYLDNGLRVVVHEDRKAPIVAVTLWYHVGSKNETRGRTGFAHLFEHLMFNGSENHDDEYFRPLQEVGGTSMNGTTDFDRTNYFQTVPTTALDTALWLESDRMGHLLGAVTQEKLDQQRGVVQNEKRQSENQPYGAVFKEIMAHLFPEGHPYSWLPIGAMEDLEAATLEDVHEWFRTYYGPNNATLVLAGDIDVATAKTKVEHFFGDIPPGPPLTRPKRWIPADVPEQRIVMEDRVPQARVYKAWAGPEWISDEATFMQLASSVLTSGKSSRLYHRLVYQDQIATSVGAFPLAGEIAGAFIVWGTAQPGGDLAQIERALDEEVERFLAEGPTPEELERVQTEVRAGFIRGVEQVGGFGGKSNILAENAVFGGRPDHYEHTLSVIESAGVADVTTAARKWIDGPGLTLEVHPYRQSLSARSEGADRSRLPMPEEFPAAPFPELQQTVLANGMRLIVAERAAVPVIRFSLQMNAGYSADQFGRPGTASLAMEMLDEGTTTRGALEIDEALARLGAQLSAGSNLDFSSVGLSALRENLDESLEIYADVILSPAFPDHELERLRRLRLSQIQQERVTPMSMALRVLPQLLYGEGHAYALPMTGSGTEESVAAITREDLIEFHQTWFKPGNATMIVVGDTTLAEIEPKLEALFAGWRAGDVPDKVLDEVETPTAPRVYLVDRPGSEQSMVIAGHLIGPKRVEDDIAIQAMNDIFGGNFTARINMNLREEKGWSYGASSTVVETAGQRPFLAYAPVQTDRTADSMAEILRELRELVSEQPATEQEVAVSKRRSTLTLPGRWETAGAVAGDIAQLVRFGLPDDYWHHYAGLVEALEVSAVRSAAAENVLPEKLIWVVVGDLARIGDEVRALGLGEVRVIDTDGALLETASSGARNEVETALAPMQN
jgi:zinc protease